uniref:FHA domain-containing protein n=1 Tax=Globisporangium ultimum (strain ATCC 200006 / CBS 805.95 / DAOM BR144) TaxID=431595 RepID=K3W9R7_GLOUD
EDNDEEDADKPDEPVEKPNFGLSGALAKDQTTGNVQNGVVMKWSEPPEARTPQKRYRLYVFKDDELISTLHVHRKSAFLVGRDKAVADILTEHQSCSKQHAVIQYRLFQKPSKDGLSFENEVRPYIMDLNSTNGTFLNGEKIEGSRYIELREKDMLKFGESTREYVLMNASS